MIRFIIPELTKSSIDDDGEFVMINGDDLDREECIIKASGPESSIFEGYLDYQSN